MLHSTLPYAGVSDLLRPRSMMPQTSISTTTVELLYFRWLSSIIMFVACQGCTPWFEARVGHLTGTTALTIIKTVKFVLFDDPDLPPGVATLLQLLGLNLQRRSREHIQSLPLSAVKKSYKALGFNVTTTTTNQEMIDAVTKQYPSHSLVFQKLVKGWCMAPIPLRGKTS
jgi:hypothetical protein